MANGNSLSVDKICIITTQERPQHSGATASSGHNEICRDYSTLSLYIIDLEVKRSS
jgi:hypothetical protein